MNIFEGINTVVSPASPFFKDGTASAVTNMKITNEGVWAEVTGTISPMAITVKGDNGATYTTSTIVSDGIAAQACTISTSGSGARQEAGIYYYIATKYDETKGCEGLPNGSKEHYIYRAFNGSDARIADVPVITAAAGCNVYRTKVIYIFKGGEIQRPQKNDITEFFYVGNTGAGTTLSDYLHDSELGQQYTFSGGVCPATPNLIASFDGRIFAFYNTSGLYARYSVSGKPVEFPQVVSLTYTTNYSSSTAKWIADADANFNETIAVGSDDITVSISPILENGATGETYLYMPELAGKSIVGAYEFKGKLWVWTADTFGYISPSGSGYKYYHLSNNFGLITNTLAIGDSFIYGCDTDGAWVLDGSFPRRLSYGIVSLTPTRAEWKNTDKEYWFGSAAQIYIYNARMDAITGAITV